MRITKRIEAGTEAGLVAGVGVVALFLVQDVLHLQPLSTPEALSGAFFGPIGIPIASPEMAGLAGMVFTGGQITIYTVLHFLTFGILGVISAYVLNGRSWLGMVAGGALFGLTACTLVFYGSRLLAGSPFVLEGLTLTSVLLANAFAGALMGFVLEVNAVYEEHQLAESPQVAALNS
jgi:hypothetical protein